MPQGIPYGHVAEIKATRGRELGTIDKLLTRVYTLADKCQDIVDRMMCQEIEDSF